MYRANDKVQLKAPATAFGVRPSPGAASHEVSMACDKSESLENSDIAAPEDGRTPSEGYSGTLSLALPLMYTICKQVLDGNGRF